MHERDYRDFEEAIAGRDTDVDLFGAVMVIARLRGEPIDQHDIARKLDVIAEAAHERAGDSTDTQSLAQAIDHELFVVRGFRGNPGAYYDPENSYFDRVVERRTGIPITLSLVYMEIAQRIGLRCDGVGFPGHFIVRCGDPESPVYVDPFHQGIRLDREELLAQLRHQPLGGAKPESFLAAVTRRQWLQRMLRNLHLMFREKQDVGRRLDVVELSLRLEPWNATLVGERGMLYYRLGEPGRALDDLQRYVGAVSPESVSAPARRLLEHLRLRGGESEAIE
ncbi:MAG: transglutaminase-like domain-containing protein [Dehalococcoidia bacterium]|nr:transglutaminase family protein [Dehalococcoidia bacterium]